MQAKASVYILASRRNGTLYIGVTNDLSRRYFEHLHAAPQSFTGRYGVKTLVYAESHDRLMDAIAREKSMKDWQRAWKIELIEKANPDWRDLIEPII